MKVIAVITLVFSCTNLVNGNLESLDHTAATERGRRSIDFLHEKTFIEDESSGG